MGGPPQHSTWDPKPDAPAEVRGEFGPIATNVPGISVSELMPRTARVADKLCVLRAVSTGDNAHSSSGYYMLTGRPHPPMNVENANPGPPNDSPSLGALVGRLGPARGGLPPAVTLPHRIFNTDGSVWPGQDAGFLGRAADPWLLNARLTPEGYRIQEIDLPAELDPDRARAPAGPARRPPPRARRPGPRPDGGGSSTARPARPSTCSARPQARRAFRLDEEPEASRDRYGETPFGQGVLLARRLVEAGVRLVQVNWYRGPDEPPANPCWDSHAKESARLKDVLVPADRPGLLGAARGPATGAACSTRRWSSAWPSSAGPPGSTATAGAATGARSSRSRWPAAASGAARSTARPTGSAPTPATAGSGPRTSRPRSSTAWAIAPRPSTSTPSAAPTRSAGARSSTRSSDAAGPRRGPRLCRPGGSQSGRLLTVG